MVFNLDFSENLSQVAYIFEIEDDARGSRSMEVFFWISHLHEFVMNAHYIYHFVRDINTFFFRDTLISCFRR